MREIALHILDLVENSLRAGSSLVEVAIDEDRGADRLRVTVMDNGPGLNVTPEAAVDPFFTTKSGKRVGLGLSLFKATAEQAGGGMKVGVSEWGGVEVEATMRLSHVDRVPLGDLATTISSVVCTNPELDLRVRIRSGGRTWSVAAAEVARELGPAGRGGLSMARKMAERIQAAIDRLELSP